MKSLFLAMLLYPDIQKKAQEELDSVIGRDRLPSFEDRPRLPFVDAVCKEILRWRPLAPLSGSPQSLWSDIRLASLLYHSHSQVSHMQSHKMTSMEASSYRRVSPDSWANMLRRCPCIGFSGAVVIPNTWWVLYSALSQ